MIPLPSTTSSQKAALLLGLLLSAIFAGCMDTADGECVEGVCTQTAKPGDVFVTNATRQVAQLDPCWGAILVEEFPQGVIASEAPPEFQPEGMFPGTERIQLAAMACDRIVVNGVVADDVHLMFTAAGAGPRDDSWSTGYSSVYLFELLVDNHEIAAALAAIGLPAQEATFSADRLAVPEGNRHDWSFRSADMAFSFDFILTNEGQGTGAGQNQIWWGEGPYHRIDENVTNTAGLYAGLGFSVLAMEGDTVFNRMVNAHQLPMAAQSYISMNLEWIRFAESFGG